MSEETDAGEPVTGYAAVPLFETTYKVPDKRNYAEGGWRKVPELVYALQDAWIGPTVSAAAHAACRQRDSATGGKPPTTGTLLLVWEQTRPLEQQQPHQSEHFNTRGPQVMRLHRNGSAYVVDRAGLPTIRALHYEDY